ncbi:R3H domain-containing nucleic acid-binding protein [Thermoflexus hugenholtzii]
MTQFQITDDLEALLNVLPPDIAQAVRDRNRNEALLEVVLDLGRYPEARYTDGEVTLCAREVTEADIQYVVSRIGEFDADNRAGIQRTLHRISAIRNRRGNIIGLTCRVGRAVYGTIDIIKDIILSGKSILLLGRPGVGKTTMLREAARVLAEHKRVIIVDTSNEIGGDGDIPHPAVGRARRMQVPKPSLQHEVMIEAVENHMPEVIIIDEIGREQEAIAARTIAERGVQLIGTAHGNSLENLLMNPTLSDLVGGIESVTLSDEEARRRGTQKSVLERRAPPTFDVLIEIKDRQHLVIHHDVAQAVDAILRGRELIPEERFVDEQGVIHVRRLETTPEHSDFSGRLRRKREREIVGEPFARETNGHPYTGEIDAAGAPHKDRDAAPELLKRSTIRIYPYGVGQNRLRAAATALNVPLQIVDNLNIADAVMTLKNYYRQQPAPIQEAERRGIPVYILRSNTTAQMEQILVDIFNIAVDPIDAFEEAMRETQEGIQRVLNGASDVTLSPQSAAIRSQQHQLVRAANLISHSYGREPYRRVRIFRR